MQMDIVVSPLRIVCLLQQIANHFWTLTGKHICGDILNNPMLASKSLVHGTLVFVSVTDEPYYIAVFLPSIYSEENNITLEN